MKTTKRIIALLIALMLIAPAMSAQSLFKQEFDLFGFHWGMSMKKQRSILKEYAVIKFLMGHKLNIFLKFTMKTPTILQFYSRLKKEKPLTI